MTRSFDDARRAAQRFEEQMTQAKSSHRLQTQEQLQAAGFAPQPRVDPNAGLPRYEDVVGPVASDEAKVETAAGQYLHDQEMAARAAAYEERLAQLPQQQVGAIQFAPATTPAPTPADSSVVGVLMQQNQQLMADNQAMREQLMTLIQAVQAMQANGHAAAPQKPRIKRAGEMTEAERQQAEYGGGGLLG